MKKTGVIAAVIVIILGVGYIAAHRGLNKPDEILIRELLLKGETAVEQRNTRDAVSCISPKYKGAPGGNYDGVRLLIANALSHKMVYDVQMASPAIKVTGDKAQAITNVKVETIVEGNRDQVFNKELTFHLVREPVKRYYIYPVKVWKIVACEGIDFLQHEGM